MNWINTFDRLPNDLDAPSKTILCNTLKIRICVAYLPDGWFSDGVVGGWESCNYCGGQSLVSFTEEDYTKDLITHWMPLPDAPKEE